MCGGGAGVPGRVQGGSGGFGRKNGQKYEKIMASLLRSNILQEVPIGQMAQGTPFRCLPWPPPCIGERGRFNLPSVQHATQGSADIKLRGNRINE